MFTGIVQAMGTIATIERNAFGVRLVIDRRDWTPPGGYAPAPGDSICVSGVCLTTVVADAAAGTLAFDVIAETLAKTSLGARTVGSKVNLEPPVTANQPMGGHFMQGHVDGVGVVTGVLSTPDEWRVTIEPPAALADYIIPKGSVALDGVSLTIASVDAGRFDVALIPTTLQLTTLGHTREGDRINIEADILAKTVVHFLRNHPAVGGGKPGGDPGVTMQTLRDAGFAG